MLKFIKKIWNTGDAVLPDDLNRYEEGIYNNEKKIGDKSVAEQIKEHNTNGVSHQDIRNLIPVIANNLTTQNAKQALSALQGYLLNQQINVLSSGRGYLDTVFLPDNYDFDLIVKNGKYKVYRGVHAPISKECGWFVDVIAQDDNHLAQYARSFIRGIDILATRQKASGVWQTWNISATTDKVDILTQEEVIPITYLNNFKQIWGGTVCIRKGSEVSLYLEINSSNVTDKSLPITTLKYAPITPVNVMSQTDSLNGSVAIVIDPSNKEVRIQPWSQSIIGNSTIATLKYTTREVFR